MEKYTIEIQFFNGQIHCMQASKIMFHDKTGEITIFNSQIESPIFPGREEEFKSILIIINNQKD